MGWSRPERKTIEYAVFLTRQSSEIIGLTAIDGFTPAKWRREYFSGGRLGPDERKTTSKGAQMDTLQELLNAMEAASKKVADLEHQLAEAKAEGKKLFNEFQKRQGDLAGKFGFAGPAESTRVRTGRKPRSVAANIAVGGSRMVTNAAQAGKSQAEAKKAGMDRALELAKKHGLSGVPDEAVKMIEATLKRRYSKVK